MSTVQASEVLERIRTRGYWRVVIRPSQFQRDRIGNLDELYRIVRTRSVQLRGWDYPHINLDAPPQRGAEWVGQEYDREEDLEVWRLYQSGQFIHFFTIAGDWRDHSRHWPADESWEHGKAIYYLHTIYSLVEIFEFGARLALSDAGGTQMHLAIDMERLAGRHLESTDSRIRFRQVYRTQAANWKREMDISQVELIARPRELAAEAARDFFSRFGLDVSVEILRRLQDGMMR